MRRPLLLLRPEPGLSDSRRRAEAMGLHVIGCPLFEALPMAWKAPDPSRFDALLLTSANAARLGGSQLSAFHHLPVHAVGEATAAAALDAGFTVASVGTLGVDALLAQLPGDARLLHLSGVHYRAAEGESSIERVAVYESRAVPRPAIPSDGEMVAAIHSPRAGRRFGDLVQRRDTIAIAAISVAAAEACGAGWSCVSVATRPADTELLPLAAKLCQTGWA